MLTKIAICKNVTDERLSSIEGQLGFSLPSEYREIIKENNGVRFPNDAGYVNHRNKKTIEIETLFHIAGSEDDIFHAKYASLFKLSNAIAKEL